MGGRTGRANPPTRNQRSWHNALAMTEKHADRLRRGLTESRPSDYLSTIDEEIERQRRTRIAIEDRALLLSLGLDPREVTL